LGADAIAIRPDVAHDAEGFAIADALKDATDYFWVRLQGNR